MSSIPPLKDADNKWVLESKPKANLLAETWQKKCKLPPYQEPLLLASPAVELDGFITLRSSCALKLLLQLDVSEASGPDKISAYISKQLAHELAVPITLLCRKMLREGKWPERWRLHMEVALYKRNSVYDPSNYRGVHLTAILSKVAERLMDGSLITQLS